MSSESEESDVEMRSTLTTKNKKMPKSPTSELLKKPDLPKKEKPTAKSPKADVLKSQDAKKLTTKEMIHNALSESKSRKGISLYAIKKHMQDSYSVDVEKVNHLIKKAIKESVETGTIVQTKGIGASGSFRLAPGIKQTKKATKKPKKPKEPKEITENGEDKEKPKKMTAKKTTKDAEPKKKVTKSVEIGETKVTKDKDAKKPKIVKEKSKSAKGKLPAIKEGVYKSPEPSSSKMKTPKKKKNNMMKRKSIGSIIKPPKMKPSAI